MVPKKAIVARGSSPSGIYVGLSMTRMSLQLSVDQQTEAELEPTEISVGSSIWRVSTSTVHYAGSAILFLGGGTFASTHLDQSAKKKEKEKR